MPAAAVTDPDRGRARREIPAGAIPSARIEGPADRIGGPGVVWRQGRRWRIYWPVFARVQSFVIVRSVRAS